MKQCLEPLEICGLSFGLWQELVFPYLLPEEIARFALTSKRAEFQNVLLIVKRDAFRGISLNYWNRLHMGRKQNYPRVKENKLIHARCLVDSRTEELFGVFSSIRALLVAVDDMCDLYNRYDFKFNNSTLTIKFSCPQTIMYCFNVKLHAIVNACEQYRFTFCESRTGRSETVLQYLKTTFKETNQ